METVSPNQGSLEGENPRAALKLEIEGMHCAGCVSSVEKALNVLVGVENAEVNLQGGARGPSPEDVIGAMREITYITDQLKTRWGTPRKAICISADFRTCFE